MKIKNILCQFIVTGTNIFFFVKITSMSFYLDWYHENKKKTLCQFIWTGTNKNCPTFIFYLDYKNYLSYLNLSGLVRTKIAPLLIFWKYYFYILLSWLVP